MASTANPSLDSQSKVAEIISVCIVSICVSSVIVGLRFYTRAKILKAVGPDDWFIAIALFCSLGTSLTVALRTRYGLGRHTWVVPESDLTPHLKTFVTSGNIYNFALMFLKTSFLLQYSRIFPNRTMLIICRTAISIVVFIGIGSLFLCTFGCRPVAALWDKSIPGKCINPLVVYLTTSVLNLITDVAIFTIPLPVIRTLQLPRKQKLILFGIFCLGFFTCSISIVRLSSMKKSVYTTDPDWDGLAPALWSVGELNVGIICACLPTLRPLLSKVVPSFLSTFKGSQSTSACDMEMGLKVSQQKSVTTSSGGPSDSTDCLYPDTDYHSKEAKVSVN